MGHCVESLEDLSKTVNNLFDKQRLSNQINSAYEIPNIINQKIYFDNQELAAEKITKVWDKFSDHKINVTSNWWIFRLFLKIIKFRKTLGKMKRSLFLSKFEKQRDNQKFPPLNRNLILERVSRLKKILGLKGLKCKLLSDRTILIRRD